jgi:hypothetical protein
MIMPRHPSPSFIIANPKQASATSRFQLHPHERRTWGDNLGIAGILSAFGSVYGEHVQPEILSASHVGRTSDHPIGWDASFFLIASPKSNPLTERFLAELQRGRAPNWRFGRCPGETQRQDFEVQMLGDLGTGPFQSECVGDRSRGEPRWDWGLLVRGPHPNYPQRLVTIMAGPHSLGTGAACLVATKTELIRQIRDRLAGQVDLAAQDRTIWVLLKGTAAEDLHLYAEGVEIVEAGVYAE